MLVLSSTVPILSGASSLSAKGTVDTPEMRACPLFVEAEEVSRSRLNCSHSEGSTAEEI